MESLLSEYPLEMLNMTITLTSRPRRNRISESVRALIRENTLQVTDLIMPYFVIDGENRREPIASMPGIDRLSPDLVVAECRCLKDLGVPAVVLFPALEAALKDRLATESVNDRGLYQRTLRLIKETVPEITIITDVAMDPYSSDGHDGVVNGRGDIVNDETLPILGRMAVSQAKAGADIIAPSDMMDGRVGYIRRCLDEAGFNQVGILAYSAKYASAYYGPFRDALDSAPKHGDKKTYQMDPANVREAIREVQLDIQEGADMVMVKPGLPYLDVVRAVSAVSTVPVAVYNVSGEYAMIKAAALNGWVDYQKVVIETMLSFKRAGADAILTYHARDVADWLVG
jgi:porphobilinogen synthase